MSFDAQVYRLFIASPSDVAEERDIVREVVSEWNATHAASRSIVLLPVGWDTDAIPQVGRRPQQAINEDVLASCDLLVGIFWNRCGSDAGTGLTGTEEEIEEHIKAGRPAMLYFSDKEGSPSVIDPDQMKAVRAFRSKIERERTAQYGTFKTTGDFRQKFFKDLAITMNKLPAQTPKLRTQSLLMADEDGLADGGEITTLQFRARSQRMSPSQGEHQTMEFTWNELFAILAPLIAQREFKITLKSEMEAEILRRVSSKGLAGSFSKCE